MKIFSTFTGIGGFEVGIQNAYRSAVGGVETDPSGINEERQGLFATTRKNTRAEERPSGQRASDEPDERPLFVGYSEIDRFATSVYEKHYPGVKKYGDITKINAEELPDFDCLVGGFPCQAFSIAGKRGGFDDTRGTLFFDLARILRAKRPRLFVFENVKGLLSHDDGKTFRTIITAIDELGYDAQWQVVNSKNHGVPQNRERIIIVGHLRGTPRPQVFPFVRTGGENTPGRALRSSTGGISERDSFVNHTPKSVAFRGRQDGSKMEIRNDHISNALRASSGGSDKSFLLDSALQIRKLTPKECERLQAFPDDWTKFGKDGEAISDNQRYKMCGNAVTTNVIRDVFIEIFRSW